MKKLIDAVNHYRNICSIIESCSVDGISIGDGLKTEKHDSYVRMLIACDELEASIYCVCADPDVHDNGQVVMCVKCGHAPREKRPTQLAVDLPSAVVNHCKPVNGVHASWCTGHETASH